MSSSYLLKNGIVATFETSTNAPRSFKADVLVEGSIITQIAEDIKPPAGVEVIDCTNKWITPGMVDTHRHTWMTLMRASQCDQLLTEYLVRNTFFNQIAMTAPEVRIGQLSGCLDALHSGVTTILDHFHAGLTPEHQDLAVEASIQSGARVIFCPARQSKPTQLFPQFEFGNEEKVAEWQLEWLVRNGKKDGGNLGGDGRVVLGFAIDTIGLAPVEKSQEELRVARESGARTITSHIVQTDRITTWKDAGILGPDVVFSHCNLLYNRPSPEDDVWAIMKEHGCAVAATPEDELGMAHGNPVAFEAVERGVKCGLGVDATSINGGDLFTQMRFALQFKRGRHHEQILHSKAKPPKHNFHTSADAFRLATLGGAEALNLSHLIGTIELNKKADIVVFDADSPNLAGAVDPFQGIVFHASNADVELVLVDGKIVKREGRLVVVDWKEVARELREKVNEFRERVPLKKEEELWEKYYDVYGPPAL